MTDSGSGAFESSEVVKAILGEKRNETYIHPMLIGYAAALRLRSSSLGGRTL